MNGPPAGAVCVRLDFWGAATAVWVDAVEDAEHLRWFYADHIRDDDPNRPRDVELSLTAAGGRGFFAACLNTDDKVVGIREGTRWRVYERFGAHSTRPTPLPPFTLEPLRSTITVHHGAAVVDDTGAAITLVGASGSGKTSLALALVTTGTRLLTDDLLVRRRSDGRLLPCARPLTLREAVWPHFPHLLAQGVPRATPDGGRLIHVRPDRAGISMADRPAPIRLIVEVSHSPTITCRREHGRLVVAFDPVAGHLPAVAEHVREAASRADRRPR